MKIWWFLATTLFNDRGGIFWYGDFRDHYGDSFWDQSVYFWWSRRILKNQDQGDFWYQAHFFLINKTFRLRLAIFLGRIFDQAHLKTKINIDDDFNLKIKLKLKAPFQKPRTNQETLFINLNLVITTPLTLHQTL